MPKKKSPPPPAPTPSTPATPADEDQFPLAERQRLNDLLLRARAVLELLKGWNRSIPVRNPDVDSGKGTMNRP